MIPSGFLQDLLARVDIVDVVGRYVQLKKAGANHMGLCPFHGEKSPSFSVSASKQFYYCFGCGAHGDAVRFLTEHNGMGFVDAVQDLAQTAGMSVPEGEFDAEAHQRAAQTRARQATLSDVLHRAAEYYRQQLKGHPVAIDYLKQRGLSGEIAQRFALGYAPAGWRSLASAFARYDDPLLVESGMVIAQGDDDDAEQKRYDRFRDRIMFPIRSVKGEVIGFGGRVLDSGEPKYLNSPETPVFIKGRELYGLFEARTAMRSAGYALVVEGYMDVVALAQMGLGNAVATLGTACTAEHLQKLFRFTDSVVFSFDGDKAGQRAAARALEAALPYASDLRTVRFLFLPNDHDPDSYVREHGAAGFQAAVKAAVPLSTQIVRQAGVGCDLATPEGRARLLAAAKPLWSALPHDGMLKRQLLGEIAQVAQLPGTELSGLWGAGPPAGPASRGPGSAWRKPVAPARRMRQLPTGPADQAARMLLLRSEWWERLGNDDHELLSALPHPHGGLFAWLERQLHDHGALSCGALQAALADTDHDPEPGALAARLLSSMAVEDSVEFDDLQAVINLLWRAHLGQRSEALAAIGGTDPLARQELQEVLASLRALGPRPARQG
ncbi:MAG: DNA primase [Rubrivivax sp.]